KLIQRHVEAAADITVAVKPVPRSEVSGLGVAKLSEDGMIVAFAEKPADAALVDEFALPAPTGTDPASGEPLTHTASMGIYCFRPDVLVRVVTESDATDFGKEVIPAALSEYRVAAYPFLGYWRDIGTISAFYEANLDLVAPLPQFNLFDASWPLYTRARYLPPAKINGSRLEHALVADGAIIGCADIRRSIVGLRGIVGDNVVLEDTVTMGNDFYEEHPPAEAGVPLGIGQGCLIRGAIIDKNTRIGQGCKIEGRPGCGVDMDGDGFYVRDGIVIIPRGQVVEPGTEIAV
ncbi:MAG: glucose-1-phosphate adenylyltransferase, partial [Armatimonadetes bacterium]|nr:glucose-1-phosphate adenylyltransferase [Armatimonadota bacterium]